MVNGGEHAHYNARYNATGETTFHHDRVSDEMYLGQGMDQNDMNCTHDHDVIQKLVSGFEKPSYAMAQYDGHVSH